MVFEDTLSQMLRAAGAPQQAAGRHQPGAGRPGRAARRINTNFSQGVGADHRPGDRLMIHGDGFFVVNSGDEQLYTRAGSFNFDADGKLVTPTGAAVQGWPAVNGSGQHQRADRRHPAADRAR